MQGNKDLIKGAILELMKECSGIKQKKGIKTIYTNNDLIYINIINILMCIYIYILFKSNLKSHSLWCLYRFEFHEEYI